MSFDYGDPIIIKKRAGSGLDPYIYYDEQYLIINNKVVLKEIPDQFQGVVVTNYFYTKSSTPASNEFTCDFTNGILNFNQTENNKTAQIQFWGTGVVFWPISRLYVEKSDSDEILQTLEQVVENANAYLDISDQLINKGVYNIETIYYKRNIVTYDNNSAYMYINELPYSNIPLADTDYWQQIINIVDTVNLLNTTNDTVNDAELIRENQELLREQQELARVDAENLRVEGGALIKSGDTMNGILNMNANINMNENEIQLGGFKIKHNPNTNSIDFEF